MGVDVSHIVIHRELRHTGQIWGPSTADGAPMGVQEVDLEDLCPFSPHRGWDDPPRSGTISDRVSWYLPFLHKVPAACAFRCRPKWSFRRRVTRFPSLCMGGSAWRCARLSRTSIIDGHHHWIFPVGVVEVLPDQSRSTQIQWGEFVGHLLPDSGDHIAFLSGVDVGSRLRGPVAQILSLIARNSELECTVRYENPEGVPRKFVHLVVLEAPAPQCCLEPAKCPIRGGGARD